MLKIIRISETNDQKPLCLKKVTDYIALHLFWKPFLFEMIGEPHLLPFRLFFQPFLPSSIVLGAASRGKASSNGEDYVATIIEPECPLRPQLRAAFLLHLPEGSRASVNTRMFSERWITLLYTSPSLLPCTLSSCLDWPPEWCIAPPCCGPVPEISLPQIRNANYVLSRRRVNKILKQQCLLRLSLPVPDGDYGTVQILVWPEIGALLNYGSHGEPLGMQRIDREVIPECWEPWEGGGRQDQIGEEVKIFGRVS